MYQSGTSCSFIAAMCSCVNSFFALPLRVISMILNAIFGSRPFRSRYVMMLSRVPITVEIVQVPSLMRSCALPSQTSVPWDRPEICSRSEKVFGCESMSICRTNGVPHSGSENVPVCEPMSSGLTPSASVEVNSDMTSGSLIETFMTGMPV